MGHGRHQIWNHSITLVEHGDVAGAPTVSNLLSGVIGLGSKRRWSRRWSRIFKLPTMALARHQVKVQFLPRFWPSFVAFRWGVWDRTWCTKWARGGFLLNILQKKAADFVGLGQWYFFFTLLHAPNLVLNTSLGCFSQVLATIHATQDPGERFFSANDWHQGFCLMFCEGFSLGGSGGRSGRKSRASDLMGVHP